MEKVELNLFEIKAEISNILTKLNDVTDFENYDVHYRTLDAQCDKKVIVKLLFKEINNPHNNQNLLKFLLKKYSNKDELVEKLWSVIKSNITSNQTKIFALDLLRDIDTNWSYETCSQYVENADELVEKDTKEILQKAIINPEVQIDFLDFLSSLSDNDKVLLINSLGDDYSKDELANMLVPVFLAYSTAEAGKTALEHLGNSRSQLAYHALNESLNFIDKSLIPAVNKNLSILKLAGIREDKAAVFYKELLKDSKPYRFCITYPDGHGNQAVIVSRICNNDKVRFVAIVIDDYKGIKDCFGFNEITQFECNTIIERFFRGQRALEVPPEVIKAFLLKAEKLSKNMPYEYVCWRTLLADIETADFTDIINEISGTNLSDEDFNNICFEDFTDYWFLNVGYSDEFEDFVKLLNNTNPENYEKIIDENVNKIFFPYEKIVWHDRILIVAVLKYLANSKIMAQNLYSLYNNEKSFYEFLKNIVRKSIYEYYSTKGDKDKINYIENMWVKNV